MTYAIISKDDIESIKIKEYLLEKLTFTYDEIRPDIVITIGGDGTILEAVQTYINQIDKILFVGIHTGHLGFYTNFKKKDIDLLINALYQEEYKIEQFNLLEYHFHETGNILSGYAINEVTLSNVQSVFVFDVFINNKLFEQVRGTGLCISTPTGSTAYNKSLHGAVVDPHLKALQLTEIAAINSNVYRSLGDSILISRHSNFKICSHNNIPSSIHFAYDHINYESQSFIALDVKLSDKKVQFVKINNDSFFDRVRKAFL